MSMHQRAIAGRVSSRDCIRQIIREAATGDWSTLAQHAALRRLTSDRSSVRDLHLR